METTLLALHIVIATVSVMSSLAPLGHSLTARRLAGMFYPSLIGLGVSGGLLLLGGASLTRSCISFSVMMALLIAFRRFSTAISYK